jgi:hypothetical protein
MSSGGGGSHLHRAQEDRVPSACVRSSFLGGRHEYSPSSQLLPCVSTSARPSGQGGYVIGNAYKPASGRAAAEDLSEFAGALL